MMRKKVLLRAPSFFGMSELLGLFSGALQRSCGLCLQSCGLCYKDALKGYFQCPVGLLSVSCAAIQHDGVQPWTSPGSRLACRPHPASSPLR